MKNQTFIGIVCGVLLCLLMIASDYQGYKTEKSVAEFIGKVFEKKFTASWGSFIVPISIVLIAFIPKAKP